MLCIKNENKNVIQSHSTNVGIGGVCHLAKNVLGVSQSRNTYFSSAFLVVFVKISFWQVEIAG